MDPILVAIEFAKPGDTLVPIVEALTISPSSKVLCPASYSSIDAILSPGNTELSDSANGTS